MKKATPWFGVVLILVIIFGTIYAATQHVQRSDANYPQIQVAEDTAAALDRGAQPSTLVGGKVDLDTTLAIFTIIYNKSGHVVTGSGFLNGSVPTVAIGVLTAADHQDYNRVTWQPQSDVRIAAVSVAAKNYYVLSGRSLKEVEKNEAISFQIALLGGLCSLAVLSGVYLTTIVAGKR